MVLYPLSLRKYDGTIAFNAWKPYYSKAQGACVVLDLEAFPRTGSSSLRRLLGKPCSKHQHTTPAPRLVTRCRARPLWVQGLSESICHPGPRIVPLWTSLLRLFPYFRPENPGKCGERDAEFPVQAIAAMLFLPFLLSCSRGGFAGGVANWSACLFRAFVLALTKSASCSLQEFSLFFFFFFKVECTVILSGCAGCSSLSSRSHRLSNSRGTAQKSSLHLSTCRDD